MKGDARRGADVGSFLQAEQDAAAATAKGLAPRASRASLVDREINANGVATAQIVSNNAQGATLGVKSSLGQWATTGTTSS